MMKEAHGQIVRWPSCMLTFHPARTGCLWGSNFSISAFQLQLWQNDLCCKLHEVQGLCVQNDVQRWDESYCHWQVKRSLTSPLKKTKQEVPGGEIKSLAGHLESSSESNETEPLSSSSLFLKGQGWPPLLFPVTFIVLPLFSHSLSPKTQSGRWMADQSQERENKFGSISVTSSGLLGYTQRINSFSLTWLPPCKRVGMASGASKGRTQELSLPYWYVSHV